MSNYTPPQYPELLTVKDWNKNKGFWAKVVGKTGVSELLRTCEKAFEIVPWGRFHFVSLLELEADPKETTLEALRKVAEQELPNIKKIEAVVDKVETLTREVHKKFKDNTLIRKASTAYVKDVADAAKAFSLEMSAKAMNAFIQAQYDSGLLAVIKAKEEKTKSFQEMYKALDAAESRMKNVKTRSEFVKFYQDCLTVIGRKFGKLFRIIPALQDNHKEFLRTCAPNRLPTSDDEIPGRLERIGPLLKSIRKKLTDSEKG